MTTTTDWKCPRCGGPYFGRDADTDEIHCHSDTAGRSLSERDAGEPCRWRSADDLHASSRCSHDWRPLVPDLPRDHPRSVDYRLDRVLRGLDAMVTCAKCGRLASHGGRKVYSYPEMEAVIRDKAAAFVAAYQ